MPIEDLEALLLDSGVTGGQHLVDEQRFGDGLDGDRGPDLRLERRAPRMMRRFSRLAQSECCFVCLCDVGETRCSCVCGGRIAHSGAPLLIV
jgi:hypothetical protein